MLRVPELALCSLVTSLRNRRYSDKRLCSSRAALHACHLSRTAIFDTALQVLHLGSVLAAGEATCLTIELEPLLCVGASQSRLTIYATSLFLV